MKTTKRLDLDDARRMADAAQREAQQRGVPVSIAICDAGGRLILFQRDDGALPISVDLAPAKARTAALGSMASGQLEDAVNKGYTALVTIPGYALLGGGVDVRVDGEVIGGIAVSGADSGDKDEQIARAGVAVLGA